MNDIKKLPWYKRLFWSWEKIVKYFEEFYKQNNQSQDLSINNFVDKLNKLNENKLSEKDKQIGGLTEEKNALNKTIEDQRKIIEDNKMKEKDLLNDIKNKEKENHDFDKKNLELKTKYDQAKDECKKLENQLNQSNKENVQLKNELKNKNNTSFDMGKQISELKTKYDQAIVKCEELKNNLNKANDLKTQLATFASSQETLKKIDRIYFTTAGNKGKGEFNEKLIGFIFEKYSISKDYWQKNLTIDGKTVEYAFRTDEENKYIPIDAKILEPNYIDNEAIIDDNYLSKLKAKAKECCNKYVDKINTINFGIIVLQNDQIFAKIVEKEPNFLNVMIKEYKMFFTSPNNFYLIALFLANTLNITKAIKNSKNIFKEIDKIMNDFYHLVNRLKDVRVNFDIALKHCNWIVDKHNLLCEKMKLEDKKVDLIENKSSSKLSQNNDK